MTLMKKLVPAIACTVISTLAACGSGVQTDDVQDAAASDVLADTVTTDNAMDDSTVRDSGEDAVVAPTCAEMIATRDMMHLLENEGRLIVHLNAAFDGQALWLGWTAFSDVTGFGTIRAARMACDGTFLVEPFDVDPDNAGNSYEAEIAVGGGNVFIAWHQDYQGYYTARTGGPAQPSATRASMLPAPEPYVEPQDVIEPDADADEPAADATDATDQDAFAGDTATADAIADATEENDADTWVYIPNDNMRVYYRTFKVDGTPVMPAALRFLPEKAGSTPQVNNWIPRVAALPDGKFVISSAWAWPEGHGFQAVAQRFNVDGTLAGDLIHPYPMDYHDQAYTDIAVDSHGNIIMVWGDTELIDGEAQPTRIASVTIPPDSTEPSENSPVFLDATGTANRTGDNPSIGITPADIAFTAWITDGTNPNIAVEAETDGRAAAGTTLFGDTWYDTYPMMAGGPSGAAMVWYRWTNTKDSVTGLYPPTEVKLAKLAWNGTGDITSIGDPIIVNPSTTSDMHDAMQYYEPVIVDVGSGNYFVMWTDSYCDPCAQAAGTGEDASEAVEAVWHYPAYARFVKP